MRARYFLIHVYDWPRLTTGEFEDEENTHGIYPI